MAAEDWVPARESAHPPIQTFAPSAGGDFDAPAGANGFYLGANGGPLMITLDGSTASATHGLAIDPGKGGVGLIPVTPKGKVSVFNLGTVDVDVEIAWLEKLG